MWCEGGEEVFENILVATDNMEIIDEALKYITSIFSSKELQLLSVVDETTLVKDQLEDLYIEISEKEAHRVLDNAASKLEEMGIKTTKNIVKGHPVREIVRFIKEHHIDIMVTETYDSRGFQNKAIEPMVGAILKNVDIPILILNTAWGLKKPKKMLLLDTDKNISKKTSDITFFIANRFNSSISVFNVSKKQKKAIKSAGYVDFKGVEKRAKKEKIPLKKLPDQSDPLGYVLKQGEEHNLIIMDAIKGGFLGKSLSSVQRKIIAHSPIPVLIEWEESK